MALLRKKPSDIKSLQLNPISETVLSQTGKIIGDIGSKGLTAVVEYAKKFGDLAENEEPQSIVISPDQIEAAFKSLDSSQQSLLTRTANRIHTFALLQRNSLPSFNIESPIDKGVFYGQNVIPLNAAGCYAPGGRYPLPSSVLMTAVTAKVAGVKDIVLASPRAQERPIILASVYAALKSQSSLNVEAVKVTNDPKITVIGIGGPQAIAAMAYGVEEERVSIPKCDVIVGPGNKWVTAAKQLISNSICRIDMLAGPSECLVMADSSAKGHEDVIAADLLAQAEHDTDALPIVLSTDDEVLKNIDLELEKQLETLDTKAVASVSVAKGYSIKCSGLQEMIDSSEKLAPEHLELFLADDVIGDVKQRLKNYGGLFVGTKSAEVFGDYGLGPNHTLPTSGTARFVGGLSVFNFVKINTVLELESISTNIVEDCANLARLEGLEGHARAAEKRNKFVQINKI